MKKYILPQTISIFYNFIQSIVNKKYNYFILYRKRNLAFEILKEKNIKNTIKS